MGIPKEIPLVGVYLVKRIGADGFMLRLPGNIVKDISDKLALELYLHVLPPEELLYYVENKENKVLPFPREFAHNPSGYSFNQPARIFFKTADEAKRRLAEALAKQIQDEKSRHERTMAALQARMMRDHSLAAAVEDLA